MVISSAADAEKSGLARPLSTHSRESLEDFGVADHKVTQEPGRLTIFAIRDIVDSHIAEIAETVLLRRKRPEHPSKSSTRLKTARASQPLRARVFLE
jgi:hypothetical protein